MIGALSLQDPGGDPLLNGPALAGQAWTRALADRLLDAQALAPGAG